MAGSIVETPPGGGKDSQSTMSSAESYLDKASGNIFPTLETSGSSLVKLWNELSMEEKMYVIKMTLKSRDDSDYLYKGYKFWYDDFFDEVRCMGHSGEYVYLEKKLVTEEFKNLLEG